MYMQLLFQRLISFFFCVVKMKMTKKRITLKSPNTLVVSQLKVTKNQVEVAEEEIIVVAEANMMMKVKMMKVMQMMKMMKVVKEVIQKQISQLEEGEEVHHRLAEVETILLMMIQLHLDHSLNHLNTPYNHSEQKSLIQRTSLLT